MCIYTFILRLCVNWRICVCGVCVCVCVCVYMCVCEQFESSPVAGARGSEGHGVTWPMQGTRTTFGDVNAADLVLVPRTGRIREPL